MTLVSLSTKFKLVLFRNLFPGHQDNAHLVASLKYGRYAELERQRIFENLSAINYVEETTLALGKWVPLLMELLFASKDGDLATVKYQVEGLRIHLQSCRDKDGHTPLHWAACNGHLHIVRYLVEEKGCEVMCRNKDGETPLSLAALRGKLDIVRYLISKQNCYPMCRGLEGSTPLHNACLNGHMDIVKYLIDDQKVDPSCPDENDFTPLHMATGKTGTLEIVKYLIEEKGCDVMCRNKYGNTPLHDAALDDNLTVVKYLISEQGCDPMCRNSGGVTPLHRACLNGNLDVVKYLIDDQKVDPSCQDENASTPLHIACGTRYFSVVRLLVEDHMCDPGIRDNLGRTPLEVAVQNGQQYIISYLSSIQNAISSSDTPLEKSVPDPKRLRLSEEDVCDMNQADTTPPNPSANEIKRDHTSSGHPLDTLPTIKQLLVYTED